jgi:putative PEP-CTERM system histidine kinase
LAGNAFVTAATWSYGIALVLYGLFALRVLIGWRGSMRASLLVLALLASAAWALAALLTARFATPATVVAMNAGDLARYGLWLAFLANLLAGARSTAPIQPGAPAASAPVPAAHRAAARSRRVLAPAVTVMLLFALLLSPGLPVASALGPTGPRVELVLHLGLAVLGLVGVEQLMRRAHVQSRWALRPLAVALAGLFGFDLFMYADAMLFSRLDVDIWLARPVAHALVIPFVAIATARNTGWTVDMHISRAAVFHSTALLASGVFLLAVAGAGYLLRFFGGAWGPALQIELLFAALLFVGLVATSGRFRARLRVFVSKHFFSYRYDYREEWLRFTRTLNQDGGPQRLQERIIMALADLVEASGGSVWVLEEGRGYVPAGRLNGPQPDAVEPPGEALPAFLARTGWIVDVRECVASPDRYDGLQLPAWLAAQPGAWLVVPLASAEALIGFVVLFRPRTPIEVDWEVRDVLKTASRQAASYLSQARATEALLEARKFDAFNRMSAFVVHDLKNLVAQMSLVLRNAERHRDNPEFQRDMLDTVAHVVERMNRLMLQLRTGATPVAKPHAVELASLARRVCAAKGERQRPVELIVDSEVAGLGHEDRIEHVLAHLVQNALDASAPGVPVQVRLTREELNAVVEVADQGIGMSEKYVKERLGKPFETTKPSGMGIGVYESGQYLASIGGRLAVESTPGKGTRVRVLLPLAERPALASAEAA